MALSATQLGVRSYIVMPRNCSPIKADLVKEYGGNLVLRFFLFNYLIFSNCLNSDITEKSRVETMK